MSAVLVTSLLSAILSAVCVFGAGWLLYQHWLRQQLEAEIRRRVEELGGVIESRVKAGILKAVEEMTSVSALQRSMARRQDELWNTVFGSRSRDESD